MEAFFSSLDAEVKHVIPTAQTGPVASTSSSTPTIAAPPTKERHELPRKPSLPSLAPGQVAESVPVARKVKKSQPDVKKSQSDLKTAQLNGSCSSVRLGTPTDVLSDCREEEGQRIDPNEKGELRHCSNRILADSICMLGEREHLEMEHQANRTCNRHSSTIDRRESSASRTSSARATSSNDL